MGDEFQRQAFGRRPDEWRARRRQCPGLEIGQVRGERTQRIVAHPFARQMLERRDVVVGREFWASRSRRSIGRMAASVSSWRARRLSGSARRARPSMIASPIKRGSGRRPNGAGLRRRDRATGPVARAGRRRSRGPRQRRSNIHASSGKTSRILGRFRDQRLRRALSADARTGRRRR